MVDGATVALAIGALLLGAVVGGSGPLFVVSVFVTLVGGPTWGGILLLAAIALGAVATAGVLLGLVLGHRSYGGTAVVIACAALIAGILTGSWYGGSVRLFGWADTYTTRQPTRTWSMPPMSRFLKAHADVRLRLDIGSDFAPNPTTAGPEGTFGHWCKSGPDTSQLADVSAMNVARLGSATIWADLMLANPSPIEPRSAITFPRLMMQVRYDDGRRTYLYAGPVRVVASDARSGRVVFDALVADPAPPGYPAIISGELTWTCQTWAPD